MQSIKNFLIFFLIIVGIPTTAQNVINEPAVEQEHKIMLSFQYGRFRAHHSQFKKIQSGNSFGGDLSAFITSRFFVTAHFNYGLNYFYDDYYSNDPGHINYPHRGNTNATVIMYNYVQYGTNGRVSVIRYSLGESVGSNGCRPDY